MKLFRRDLLKALPALLATPVIVKGQEVGKAFKVEPDARYVVFLNAALVDPRAFCENNDSLPPGTMIHGVAPHPGQSMDDVIRIYKTK